MARPERTTAWGLAEVRWAAASVALFAVAALAGIGGGPGWATDLVWGACYLAGGWRPALDGIDSLRRRSLDVDLLMVVATAAAAALGQWLDAGLLIVIFATSGAQEAVATRRTADSVRSLLALAPERATRVTGGGEGSEEEVDAADLVPGDVILVRPGERIGADGVVVAGAGEVDQASLTGEPLPVLREEGDDVFAGSLTRDGALWVRVRVPAAESVVARIVAMVEEASATKARAQLLVERVEQRYSVGMVAATVVVLAVPVLAGEALRPALLRAMTFMIVASPCAVVLATMPPLLAAVANAGRHGVLVRSSVVMEQLGAVTAVAWDKTGTLTTGRPGVESVVAVGMGEPELLALAASAEAPSEHPLARAIVAAAREGKGSLVACEAFASAPGRGVEALVGGTHVAVRSPRCVAGLDDVLGRALGRVEDAGATAVVVTVDHRPAGVIGLRDVLRPGAPRAVAELADLTGAAVLLTGDGPVAAGRVGASVGIADVRADLLPADKLTAVAGLAADGHRVLAVGDGVNDAPCLAAAHAGVAMGRGGTDLDVRSADAILVADDLGALPCLVALSRRARRAVAQNLVLAGAAILGLVAWDLAGHLPLPLGVLGHEGGTVLVGLNGLRLLRSRAWAAPAAGGPGDRPRWRRPQWRRPQWRRAPWWRDGTGTSGAPRA